MYSFIQVLIKMKQAVLLPMNIAELGVIRKYPQKVVDPPVYSKQKVGIILYSFMLLFIIVMFIAGYKSGEMDWTFYLLFLLPLSYSHDLLNLFAFVEDGILCGSRFIPWNKIRSYQIVPININHKYYGYSIEVNEGYEVIIKTKVRSFSCIVTSDQVKEKMVKLLNDNVRGDEIKESK